MGDDEATNVKVMVRMRLFNQREINESKKKNEKLRPVVKMRGGTTCCIVEHVTDSAGFVKEVEREAFVFDDCFWSMPDEQGMADRPFATQHEVYSKSGFVAMQTAFQGFNVCIFAYGQTGAGKTYSMLGTQKDPGISPRICDDLFVAMNNAVGSKCTLECTFFEIYNEKVRDLFNKKTKQGHYDPVKIRQHPTRGVYVEGLTARILTTAEEAKNLIEKGTNERAVAETKMNKHSSRSHAVFQLHLTQLEPMKGTQKTSTINLVDLAGSEKVKKSEAEGMTLTEATNINKSLSTLRRVIDILIENSQSKRQQVPPFRETVLTYVLSDSLGGNSKTQMIAAISPHASNMEDSIGTLRYALRAKDIVCNAKVNEAENAEAVDAMRDEIEALKRQMRSGGGGGGTMMPADIEKVIAEREEEVKKMEEGMADAIEEYKHKEVEMERQIEEQSREQMKLATEVNEQKRERFAAAFRSAFTLAKDKKRIEAADEELNEARVGLEVARKKSDQLVIELAEKTDEAAQLFSERNKLETELKGLKETTAVEHAKLTRQNEDLTAFNKSLDAELEKTKNSGVRNAIDLEDALARIERLQDDMVGLTQAVEREQMEKANVVHAFEESAAKNSLAIDAVRRRKEHYKQMHGEEEVRASSLKGAIAAHSQDRQLLLETIKAQQKLLEEKDFLIQSTSQAHTETLQRSKHFEDLAEKRHLDIQQLMESLREYQNASHQWRVEHSVQEKELARLRLSQNQSRLGSVEAQASPLGVMLTTPRKSQSPTAARARSPMFRQPRVERVDPSAGVVSSPTSPSASNGKPRRSSPMRY